MILHETLMPAPTTGIPRHGCTITRRNQRRSQSNPRPVRSQLQMNHPAMASAAGHAVATAGSVGAGMDWEEWSPVGPGPVSPRPPNHQRSLTTGHWLVFACGSFLAWLSAGLLALHDAAWVELALPCVTSTGAVLLLAAPILRAWECRLPWTPREVEPGDVITLRLVGTMMMAAGLAGMALRITGIAEPILGTHPW